jgi:uncharacterized RDD family membrane protein YckC
VADDIHTELGGEPAGFWRRLASSLIDSVVVGIVSYILVLALGGIGNVLGIAVSAAYFTYFHGSTGQTPGNAALGIRVVDVRDRPGRPIGYNRATLRWLVSIVSGLALTIGYLWMLWDPQKQTWHDKAAASLPVKIGY